MKKPERPIEGAIWVRGMRVVVDPESKDFDLRAALPRMRLVAGGLAMTNQHTDFQQATSHRTFPDGLHIKTMKRGDQMILYVTKRDKRASKKEKLYGGAFVKPYGGVIIHATRYELAVYDGEADPAWKIKTTADLMKQPPDPEPPIYRTIQLIHEYSPSKGSSALFAKDKVSMGQQIAKISAQIATLDPQTQEALIHKLSMEMRVLQALISITHGDGDYVLRPNSKLATFDMTNEGVPHHYDRYKNAVPQLGENPTVADSEDYDIKRVFKPTMFTGRMRQLIQYWLGLGVRKVVSSAEEDGKPYVKYDYRTAKQAENGTWMAGIPSYQALFHNSTGLYRSPGGRMYAIKITPAGIFAMRLPVVRRTKDRLPESMQDWFDDVPLCIGFPRDSLTPSENALTPKPKTPWAKAITRGWLFKINCPPLDKFYELSPTYTECCWAFSYSGKKIANIGWKYNAGGPPFDYKIMEMWEITLEGGDGNSQTLYDYALTEDGYDRSINTLTATMDLGDSGPAAATGLERLASNLKFPVNTAVDWQDLGREGVVSFDCSPAGMIVDPLEEPYKSAVKRFPITNCMVHCFYDGEEIQWLRMYHNPFGKPAVTDSWDTTADSEWAATEHPNHVRSMGAYNWGYTTEPVAQEVNGFYSNKIDPRQPPERSEGNWYSTGKKVQDTVWGWVPYTFPYPPLAFGWQDSLGPYGIENIPGAMGGSPWCAPFQVYHINITGTETIGRRFAYAAAVPVADREAMFLLEREYGGTENTFNNWYTTCCMSQVAYVAPEWIPDLNTITNLSQVLYNFRTRPPGSESSTTYKYTHFILQFDPMCLGLNESGTWPKPEQYEQLQIKAYPTININSTNNDKSKPLGDKVTITTIQSKVIHEYSHDMSSGDTSFWFMWLPKTRGELQYTSAPFSATRSVIGDQADAMSNGVHGTRDYRGWNRTQVAGEAASNYRSVTFIGETK